MAAIFHLALANDWAAAQASGAYTTSTRGRTLAEEGFIHASRGDQWPAVREAFYADVDEPLVLLRIDTDLLDVPVVEEPVGDGGTETFPHIYGPLPVRSVVRAIPLAARPAHLVQSVGSPADGFSRVYFREMFFNVAVLSFVISLGLAGAALGGTADRDGSVGLGGLAGLAVGVAAGVLLYRRRHHGRP